MKKWGAVLALLVFITSVAAQDSSIVISPENAASLHEIVVNKGQGAIDAMALSRDELWMAVGANDTIYMYDLKEKGGYTNTFVAEGESLTTLEFDYSTSFLAAGTESGSVYIWNRYTGSFITKIEAGKEAITDLMFLTEPLRIVIGGKNDFASIWTVNNSVERTKLVGLDGDAKGIALVDNGTRIAIAGSNAVYFWDADTGFLQDTIEGLKYVAGMAFNPTHPIAIALVFNRKLIMDGDLGAKGGDFVADEEVTSTGLRFSPDGKWLANIQSEAVELRNADTGELVRTLNQKTSITSVAFSPDGARLYVASNANVVIWDTNTGEMLNVLDDEYGLSESISYSPDGNLLAVSNYLNGTINLYDGHTLEFKHTLVHDHSRGVQTVTFSPDGKYLASGGDADGNSIILWDMSTGKAAMKLTGHTEGVRTLAFSPDGTTLLSVSGDITGGTDVEDNSARLWDVATGKLIRQWQPHGDNDVLAGLFTPDGTTIITSGDDNFIRLWNVESGDSLGEVEASFIPFDLAMDAQLTRLVYNSSNDTNFLPLTAPGKFTPPAGYVSATSASAVFDPAGDLIVTQTNDNDILLYDIAAKAKVATIATTAGLNAMVFSPDGTRLATVSDDGKVRLWGVDSE